MCIHCARFQQNMVWYRSAISRHLLVWEREKRLKWSTDLRKDAKQKTPPPYLRIRMENGQKQTLKQLQDDGIGFLRQPENRLSLQLISCVSTQPIDSSMCWPGCPPVVFGWLPQLWLISCFTQIPTATRPTETAETENPGRGKSPSIRKTVWRLALPGFTKPSFVASTVLLERNNVMGNAYEFILHNRQLWIVMHALIVSDERFLQEQLLMLTSSSAEQHWYADRRER